MQLDGGYIPQIAGLKISAVLGPATEARSCRGAERSERMRRTELHGYSSDTANRCQEGSTRKLIIPVLLTHQGGSTFILSEMPPTKLWV